MLMALEAVMHSLMADSMDGLLPPDTSTGKRKTGGLLNIHWHELQPNGTRVVLVFGVWLWPAVSSEENKGVHLVWVISFGYFRPKDG